MIEGAELLTMFLNIGRAIYESEYGKKTGGKAEIGGTLNNGNKIVITINMKPQDNDEEVHDD